MHNLLKYLFLWMFTLGIYGMAAGQTIPDSVMRQYASAKTDKDKLYLLTDYLDNINSDTSFVQKSAAIVSLLKSVNDDRNLDYIQLIINDHLAKIGDYVTALASTLEITNRSELQKDTAKILAAYRKLGNAYYYAGDFSKDIEYLKKALLIANSLNDIVALSGIANNISATYTQKKYPDSALVYGRMGLRYARHSGDMKTLAMITGTLADVFIVDNQYDSALIYARESLGYGNAKNILGKVWTLNALSQIFLESNQYDSSIFYAHEAITIASELGFKDQLQSAYENLSLVYNRTYKPDSAFKYLQLAVAIKDALYSSDKLKQVQGVLAREESRLEQIEKERLEFQNKMKVYGLIAGLVTLGIIAFLQYRNNGQKQKANLSLKAQKEKVENTLQDLKLTQLQLIQSEKMASLGELTAGIAHEIQNPLNFVNNFSELSNELISEMVDEVDKGNTAEVKSIAKDVQQNLEKILHHGKRADAIVKGMLQHSRSSSGQKEPTDINALCDEYLRLSYHGLRAKDKTFNATLKTDFDESIGNINIIPQDIGRVILNLINNAFYVVDEKKKDPYSLKGGETYKPVVTVTTRRLGSPSGDGGKVLISVKDNGPGIPKKILDKIFQPFFTTKPTGQGTGLGLSLSYDIVKAHGGELKVETKEGEETTFIITL
jgi:two-component system, NtrC family, sensor kinase